MISYEIIMINKILKERGLEHLICASLYNKAYETILSILNIPKWEITKFQPLLTPTIWSSNPNRINEVLAMPYWDKLIDLFGKLY